jgi:hypothetical protein
MYVLYLREIDWDDDGMKRGRACRPASTDRHGGSIFYRQGRFGYLLVVTGRKG